MVIFIFEINISTKGGIFTKKLTAFLSAMVIAAAAVPSFASAKLYT